MIFQKSLHQTPQILLVYPYSFPFIVKSSLNYSYIIMLMQVSIQHFRFPIISTVSFDVASNLLSCIHQNSFFFLFLFLGQESLQINELFNFSSFFFLGSTLSQGWHIYAKNTIVSLHFGQSSLSWRIYYQTCYNLKTRSQETFLRPSRGRNGK